MNKIVYLFIESFVIISVFTVSTLLYIQYLESQIVNTIIGCDGIELWYNNHSFIHDASNIEYNQTTVGYNTITPREFYYTGNGDCKTVSNTIYCLSKLYNVSCYFYHIISLDSTPQNISQKYLQKNNTIPFIYYLGITSHVGTKCSLDGGQTFQIYN